MNALALCLHVLSAIVWIGGMFFAIVVVRPSAASLEPPARLELWAGIFKRFFPWVWMAVVFLLLSGYWMIFYRFGGMSTTPGYVHYMHLLGLLMAALFIYLYYVVYPGFKSAVAEQDWPVAAASLNRIRHVVLVNLVLGFLLVAGVTLMQ